MLCPTALPPLRLRTCARTTAWSRRSRCCLIRTIRAAAGAGVHSAALRTRAQGCHACVDACACGRVYACTCLRAHVRLYACVRPCSCMGACLRARCMGARAPMCMLAREHTGGGQRVLALPSPHARIRRSSDAVASERFWCDATSSGTTAGHPHLPATRPRRLQLLLSGEMVSLRRSSARRHAHAACVARRCAARADRLEWAGWARGSAV